MPLRPPPDERSPNALLEFGVVLLDKPAGPTSHQVSEWVGDLCDVTNTGHGGTLDPSVTGCLPVMLGSATRLTSVLAGGTKEYVAILELHDDPPAAWREVIASFEGDLYQRPPRKSAVARRMRIRRVDELEVIERADRRLLLRIVCEAGTYVRKLCHDLGLAMGTGGHMAALRRTMTTPFTDADLVSLHDLADGVAYWREDGDEAALRAVVQPGEAAIAHLPKVTITRNTAAAVANGAPVYAPGIVAMDDGLLPGGDPPPLVRCATPSGSAVCLGRLVADTDVASGPVVDLERVLV